MTTPLIIFNLFLVAMLALDLGLVHGKTGSVSVKQSLAWCGIWIGVALVFGGGIFWFQGSESGVQFLTGYVIEKSLSIDNIFLFAIIFKHFGTPPEHQHRVLFWGVVGALAMRLLLIFIGSSFIEKYQWILYIFGAFLVITGIKMLLMSESAAPKNMNDALIVRLAHRFLPIATTAQGPLFFIKIGGKWFATPLFIVLLLIESTDLIFAVDSIPAIFAVTTDPFIIYTSNALAILGLRSLYFALADIMEKFRYLKVGLAIILVFIGSKMLLEPWIHIPSLASLIVTIGILAASMAYSLIAPANR